MYGKNFQDLPVIQVCRGKKRHIADIAMGPAQVSEQVLSALGVEVCADLVAKRGLLAALFSPISVDFFMEVGPSNTVSHI